MKFRNLLSAILSVMVFAACSPKRSSTPPPPPKVTVRQPLLTTVTNWDEYPGHLEAVEMVEVRPHVSGYIDSIHFQDGAEVKAGDLLFVIDPRPYQAELEHAQAQSRQAETHLEWVRDDLKRAEGLRGTKAISEEEWDARRQAAREAESALAATKAAENTTRISLEYTQVKAPIGGKIGRRLVTAGNFVQLQGNNGAAALLTTIVSLDPIYCYFDVEEGAFLNYRASAKAAEALGGALPIQISLVGEDGFKHLGKIDFFDNQVNHQTGTIRLRGVLDNEDRTLVPGMFATVRVMAGAPQQALLVPDVAVMSDQGYKFVYVVNAEGKVERRSIETGRPHGAFRAVAKGLTPGDRVAVNGLIMLRDGMKVDAQVAADDAPAANADKKVAEAKGGLSSR